MKQVVFYDLLLLAYSEWGINKQLISFPLHTTKPDWKPVLKRPKMSL